MDGEEFVKLMVMRCYFEMDAAISLKELAIGVGFQFKTLNVSLLSKDAFFPMNGNMPLASGSNLLMNFRRKVGAFIEGAFL